tara:strand:+ start:785 stop:1618 length:834 start_codon:yes stop_codon:yes gene_type:complete
MVLGPIVRAGSKLVKKGLGTGKRKSVDKDGKVITVNASHRTVNQPDGLDGAKKSAIGRKVQNKPAAKKVRKVEGKVASDLTQDAMGTLGSTADTANAGIPKFMKDAFKAKGYDEALKNKKEALVKHKDKVKSLKGIDLMRYLSNTKETVKALKRSIKDMEIRGGPGGKSKKRKTGGQVMKKAGGGKMSHVGLYPAEEARSGTMSEKKRATNMAYGGKVKKYSRGGRVNTSRENRLEELGRVDAEKAHTSKGKRNLRSEKKRIVKELTGNDFVASYYD